MAVFEGGCLCGAIRYRVEGEPFNQTNCHCMPCRRSAGAAYLAWASFRTSGFRYTKGEPKRYRSSDHAGREFCGACGTQLTFRDDGYPDEVDVTVGSMDDGSDPALHPKSNIWVRSALSWTEMGDLPKHETMRR